MSARKKAPYLLVLILVVSMAGTLIAAVPTDRAEMASLIGQPVKLSVQPESITFDSMRTFRQLVVSAHYTNGSTRDVTPFVTWRIQDPKIITLKGHGLVSPQNVGTTTLTVEAAGKTVRVPVTVRQPEQAHPVSFRHDVIAALSVGGCNAGACHGTPSGKNGFRLSLRGYDPDTDYIQLTRDLFGRRTSRHSAASSLILQKALGHVPHQGGVRFDEESVAAARIRAWLKAGLPDDVGEVAKVVKLDITPGARVLQAPARWQQLAVQAHFSDGQVRDVTRLTVFTSSETSIADVDRTGLVEFRQAGEVAILCRYLDRIDSVRLIYLQPKKGFVWPNPPENNYVDTHVFHKLKMLNIQPSDLCCEEDFIRRAYLDVCAVLPSPKEVRAFLKDNSKKKRSVLIDRLLQKPEYADFWTMKCMDVLRSTRKKLHLTGAKAYQQWMRKHIHGNTRFDHVVRELLTADGSTYKNGAANYYRATSGPEELAEVTAQLFFGIRMQCAKCHNHPFEKWTQDDYYSTAAFFAHVRRKRQGRPKRNQLVEEFVYLDKGGRVQHLRTGAVMPPRFLGGLLPKIDKNTDRRQVLAKWLTARDNPFFARSVVNRIWYHLMSRGIVDPVDDFRDSNPPANEELLDALATDFVKHDFDVKYIIRTIMNSRTYQLSAVSNKFNKDDEKYFSKAVSKLLTAEQLLDAICQATEVPEHFAGFPRGTRATQLTDGEVNNQFLKTFGQPARELACECERGGQASLAQALQLLNGKTVHEKLVHKDNRLSRLLRKKLSDREMLDELYLATLSRFPQAHEVQASLRYVQRAEDRRTAWEDVLWALLNTKEFMFRH